MKKYRTLTLLSLAIVAYLVLSMSNIELPGPYGDEFLQAPAAVYLLTGSNERSGRGVTVGGRFIPLMANEYIGALRTYALIPAYYLLGFRVLSHRLTTIIITAIGLMLLGLLARSAIGDVAAVISTWLIATDPTLVLMTRADFGPAAIPFTLRVAGYYLVWRWWSSRGRDIRSLFGAAVVVGLGIYDKTNFFWMLLALAGVVLVARLWQRFDGGERTVVSLWHLGIAGVLMVLASAPLWLLNLRYDWITFRNATLPGQPVTLQLLIERIPSRNANLLAMFNSGAIGSWMAGEDIPTFLGPLRSLLLPLTLLAVGLLVFFAIRQRRRELLVLPALGVLLLAQMYLTPRPIAIHHLIFLYPLPHLAIGLAVSVMLSEVTARWQAAMRTTVTAVLLVAIALNVLTLVRFHQAVRRTGGSALWTESIHTLSDTLKREYADRTIQVLDWGIASQLVVLSGGRLEVREPIYDLERSQDAARQVVQMTSNPRTVFVLHGPEAVEMKLLGKTIEAAISNSESRISKESQIRDRAGRVVFRIVEFH